MMYEKLPVVLLMEMAASRQDELNHQIARYILANRDHLADITLNQLAADCHVGTGSISRFCRQIGLENFQELRSLLAVSNTRERPQASKSWKARTDSLRQEIQSDLQETMESISEEDVIRLCQDLHRFDKIAVFGLLKAAGAALSFQADLAMLLKPVYTAFSYAAQKEYLANASKQDLIVIFAWSGSYFDYLPVRELQEGLQKATIWMIAPLDADLPPWVDHSIRFQCKPRFSSHPYTIHAAASLIVQEYRYLYG